MPYSYELNSTSSGIQTRNFMIRSQVHLIFIIFFLFFTFFGGVLPTFQEYFTYMQPIVHQRWAKIGEAVEKHLTIRKQNLAFPHVTWVRIKLQWWET